ncbi:MAG: GH92 family glycosyl hydrolase [Clostridia bacterium]
MLLFTTPVFAQTNYTVFVNPIIGTNAMGHTFPGVCVPFGSVQLSPDTDTIPHNVKGIYQPKVYEYCAGYQYKDKTIVGFSHTHLSGTGHSDLGDIMIMPTTGQIRLNSGTSDRPEAGYRSAYSHQTEESHPGYYSVVLSDYKIKAQLTATTRVGVHKYTYPQGKMKNIILDLNHGIYNYEGKTLWTELRVENNKLLTGYRITNGWARTNYTYFAISFSQPISDYGYTDKAPIPYNGGWVRFDQYHNFPEMAGRKLVSFFRFDAKNTQPLTVKVALSAVSTQGAMNNLNAEAKDKSFEQIAQEADDHWNDELKSIDVEGSADQKAMFYTSYYHTLINPSVYTDVDGKYRGIDHCIHQATDFTNYTVFSLWDTYRAEHPFLNLMKPKQAKDMISSMIAHQHQSVHGLLPIWSHMGNENWCMSGYHAVSVLADAIQTGIFTEGAKALKAMVATSNVSYYGGIKAYKSLHYVPLENSSISASNTLEYSYDDWAIYHTAQLIGDQEIEASYKQRALYYRNLFDTSIGWIRPKDKTGVFKEKFDILQTHGEGFIEGNAMNFSFDVPQDIKGMISLMGGDKAFVKKLDKLFTMHLPETFYSENEDITKEGILGGYVHGNEPSHHIPYLYAWSSQPWKTQYWTREILNKMYKNNINGLSGNDDCGQMSAWYIFSSMGFYPVCPGSGQYVLSAPYLPYIKLSLPNGKIFEIKAPNVSDKDRYVKSVTLNGQKFEKLYINYKDIQNGGTLIFNMVSSPNKLRGKKNIDKPYSLTD